MRRPLAIAALTLMLATACGSGGGGAAGDGAAGTSGAAGASAPAGVDGTKQVSAATATDKTATCDWFAGLAGGYGAPSSCAEAQLSAPPSQADCEASFPSCDVTFADFASCVVNIINAQNTECTQEAIQEAEASNPCLVVLPANCFGAN